MRRGLFALLLVLGACRRAPSLPPTPPPFALALRELTAYTARVPAELGLPRAFPLAVRDAGLELALLGRTAAESPSSDDEHQDRPSGYLLRRVLLRDGALQTLLEVDPHARYSPELLPAASREHPLYLRDTQGAWRDPFDATATRLQIPCPFSLAGEPQGRGAPSCVERLGDPAGGALAALNEQTSCDSAEGLALHRRYCTGRPRRTVDLYTGNASSTRMQRMLSEAPATEVEGHTPSTAGLSLSGEGNRLTAVVAAASPEHRGHTVLDVLHLESPEGRRWQQHLVLPVPLGPSRRVESATDAQGAVAVLLQSPLTTEAPSRGGLAALSPRGELLAFHSLASDGANGTPPSTLHACCDARWLLVLERAPAPRLVVRALDARGALSSPAVAWSAPAGSLDFDVDLHARCDGGALLAAFTARNRLDASAWTLFALRFRAAAR